MEDCQNSIKKFSDEIGGLISDFKKLAFSNSINNIEKALIDLDAIERNRPSISSPPTIVWIIQPDGYKKIVDNPQYEQDIRRNDLILQPWWESKKESELRLYAALSEFLVLFERFFYLENGAIPRFMTQEELFRHLGSDLLSKIVPDEYKDSDGCIDVDPTEWLMGKFSKVDCSSFLYTPEPIIFDKADPHDPHFHSEEYQEEYVEDEYDPGFEEYEEDQYVYENTDDEEFRREMAEEFYGYMDDQYRSEEEGWYYSDDGDDYVSEDY